MAEKQLTKTQKRLVRLFKNVQDENIREIINEVIVIESANRSTHNFPIRKIREVVEDAAKLQENNEED
jgi:hypothetical protein